MVLNSSASTHRRPKNKFKYLSNFMWMRGNPAIDTFNYSTSSVYVINRARAPQRDICTWIEINETLRSLTLGSSHFSPCDSVQQAYPKPQPIGIYRRFFKSSIIIAFPLLRSYCVLCYRPFFLSTFLEWTWHIEQEREDAVMPRTVYANEHAYESIDAAQCHKPKTIQHRYNLMNRSEYV